MKKLAFLTAAALSFGAQAQCFGTGSFRTCMDASGNSYTIQQFGNTTMMQGYNANTGSSWNQNSLNLGNTTIHNGTASNGQMWNGTTTNLGTMQIHQGIDSNGNPYSRTCGPLGCF